MPSLSFWGQRQTAKGLVFRIKSAIVASSDVFDVPPIVLPIKLLLRGLCSKKDKDKQLRDWLSTQKALARPANDAIFGVPFKLLPINYLVWGLCSRKDKGRQLRDWLSVERVPMQPAAFFAMWRL